jgi:hypothetical protein
LGLIFICVGRLFFKLAQIYFHLRILLAIVVLRIFIFLFRAFFLAKILLNLLF